MFFALESWSISGRGGYGISQLRGGFMSQLDFSAVSPGKSLRPHPVKISKLSTILLDPTTLTLWQYMPTPVHDWDHS